MDTHLSETANSPVSEAVVHQLAKTKGWARLFSVLLWIGAAFLILGGVAMLLIGASGGLADGFGDIGIASAGIGIIFAISIG